mmetsp:Transcript_86146/g.238764  ORF Transcript_86146/g.238764 Transcript_86146/m.238764 type:complete len:263 (-) Transcript_86146:253-1041(-)
MMALRRLPGVRVAGPASAPPETPPEAAELPTSAGLPSARAAALISPPSGGAAARDCVDCLTAVVATPCGAWPRAPPRRLFPAHPGEGDAPAATALATPQGTLPPLVQTRLCEPRQGCPAGCSLLQMPEETAAATAVATPRGRLPPLVPRQGCPAGRSPLQTPHSQELARATEGSSHLPSAMAAAVLEWAAAEAAAAGRPRHRRPACRSAGAPSCAAALATCCLPRRPCAGSATSGPPRSRPPATPRCLDLRTPPRQVWRPYP